MSIIQPSRRGFLAGLGALIAAPAIVRASSLMPVSAIERYDISRQLVAMLSESNELLDDMIYDVVHTNFYGNPDWAPIRFTGFRPCYSLLNDDLITDPIRAAPRIPSA